MSTSTRTDVQDFGWALWMLKQGGKVARAGWNGKNMHIELHRPEGDFWEPCILMHTAQGRFQLGWLASQADMLAEDWMGVLDEDEAALSPVDALQQCGADMGRAAYAAYCEAVGGTTYDGKPLPAFDDLDERQQKGWAAAALP